MNANHQQARKEDVYFQLYLDYLSQLLPWEHTTRMATSLVDPLERDIVHEVLT